MTASQRLVELAALLWQLEIQALESGKLDTLNQLAARLPDHLGNGKFAAAWTRSADDLLRDINFDVVITRLSELVKSTNPLDTSAAQAQVLAGLKAAWQLDLWHQPVLDRFGDSQRLTWTQDHNQLDTHLRLEGTLAHTGSGTLIPRWSMALMETPDRLAQRKLDWGNRPMIEDAHQSKDGIAYFGLLSHVMSETVYLPPLLKRQRPGLDDGSKAPVDGSQISVRYRRLQTTLSAGRLARRSLRVAVSPVMIFQGDLEIEGTGLDRECYKATPTYQTAQLLQAVDQAIAAGADLMFLPEVSVREADLGALKDHLRARFIDSDGETFISYLFLGVAGEDLAGQTPDMSTNYLVGLDGTGSEILRQDKMFRWDFEQRHFERFMLEDKIRNPCEINPEQCVREGIVPGTHVELVELEDLGRILGLICADVSYNLPQDFLLEGCGIDWLYIPILDGSLNPPACAAGGSIPMGDPGLPQSPPGALLELVLSGDQQWIIRRAFRAAALGSTRVVVVNSLAMTHRLNQFNVVRNQLQYYVDSPKFAVLIEPNASILKVQFAATSASSPELTLSFTLSSDGWLPL